jgi:hypothetical protein
MSPAILPSVKIALFGLSALLYSAILIALYSLQLRESLGFIFGWLFVVSGGVFWGLLGVKPAELFLAFIPLTLNAAISFGSVLHYLRLPTCSREYLDKSCAAIAKFSSRLIPTNGGVRHADKTTTNAAGYHLSSMNEYSASIASSKSRTIAGRTAPRSFHYDRLDRVLERPQIAGEYNIIYLTPGP